MIPYNLLTLVVQKVTFTHWDKFTLLNDKPKINLTNNVFRHPRNISMHHISACITHFTIAECSLKHCAPDMALKLVQRWCRK